VAAFVVAVDGRYFIALNIEAALRVRLFYGGGWRVGGGEGAGGATDANPPHFRAGKRQPAALPCGG